MAEELAQDALVAALEQWPESGVPDNPAAWLMATAKHRTIDMLRRGSTLERKQQELARELELERDRGEADIDAALDDYVGDDLLRLMFLTCHPVLSKEARTALTLRLLGGLTTDEIARAFLVAEPTVAQRIVRAKRTLAAARVPFELPPRDELNTRLASVLEVIYLIFNEGYAATAGDDWIRPALLEEALRLGRVLAGLAPEEPEVHGLVALMEIQASRSRARVDTSGDPVLLLDQDRARWDQLLIRRGLAALERAEERSGALGPYTLQAAIAACHARARSGDETDWDRIVALYDALAELTQSPVVELNRAMAIAMASGPEAGLEIVDELVARGALDGYHLLPAVRGELLEKLGRLDEARSEFELAASMTRNARARDRLLDRAASLTSSG
jgi:RNA polymerase sigma factor (sigma-70 family)